jgi:hypothetical protein
LNLSVGFLVSSQLLHFKKITMHQKIIKLIPVFLLFIGLTGVQAQHTLSGTGGDATGSNGTISYSVGQIFYTNLSGDNGSLDHGVQNALLISSQTGIAEDIALEQIIYPNPVKDHLVLQVDRSKRVGLSWQLFDMNGRLLKSNTIQENTTWINMNDLPSSVYLLKIYQGENTIKTFKIIKN